MASTTKRWGYTRKRPWPPPVGGSTEILGIDRGLASVEAIDLCACGVETPSLAAPPNQSTKVMAHEGGNIRMNPAFGT